MKPRACQYHGARRFGRTAGMCFVFHLGLLAGCGPQPPNGVSDSPTDKPAENRLQKAAKRFYFNDFETSVGSEWSTDVRDTTPIGSRRFLGQFRNETVTLSLSGLPPHTAVTLSFDLYIIGSWDGNVGVNGPNLWTLAGRDGKPIFETTFAYWPSATQAYPNVYPVGNNPAHSGAIEINSLGYKYFEGGQAIEWNSVYNMSFTLADTADSVAFHFTVRNLDVPGSKSWGLDNVSLLITPQDEWQTALVLNAADFVSRPVGGAAEDAWNIWSTGRITDWLRIDPACTRIRANTIVRGDPAYGNWPIMGILFNQRFEASTTVAQHNWTTHSFDLDLTPGVNQVAFCYTNDQPPQPGQDRNLYARSLEIQVPSGTPPEAWPVRVPPPDDMAEPPIPATDEGVVALANENIEKYRKGDFHVAFVDPSGAALSGAPVQASMFRHAFKWGTAVRLDLDHPQFPLEQAYRRDLGRMFNHGTTENLIRWGAFEAVRGQPRYDAMDTYLSLCTELGVDLKAHNIIWGHFEDLPTWLTSDDLDHAMNLLETRTRGLVGHYRGRVASYDVVNEPLHALQWEFWAGPSYLESALKWAREEDPAAQLLVNEYEIVAVPDMCDNFYVRMKDVRERGGPFDGVGIQLHSNLGEWYTPREMWRGFERMAQLGVSLHLTEVSLGELGGSVRGGPYEGEPWTDELQAEYYEQVMRVTFGHPAMESLTFWGFTDRRHYQPGSGLLDEALKPKAAALRYAHLLQHEWSTEAALRTSAAGSASFRGFFGWYRFTSGNSVGVAYLSAGSTGTTQQPVVVTLRPFGDADGDGVFGEGDMPAFVACYNQSASGPVLAPCVPFDANGDANVDCTDHKTLSPRYVGVKPPPLPPCTIAPATVTAMGCRYLAVTVPSGSQPVALRVTSEDWLCLSRYIDANGFLVAQPVYRLPAEWNRIVVADPFIVPDTTYAVQVDIGGDLSAPAAAKTWKWGDVNNDSRVDEDDLKRVLDAFHGDYSDLPFENVDVAPCVPNRGVDLDDVTAVMNAVNGESYYLKCPRPCNPDGLPWDPEGPPAPLP